jgi:hypothetical protein
MRTRRERDMHTNTENRGQRPCGQAGAPRTSSLRILLRIHSELRKATSPASSMAAGRSPASAARACSPCDGEAAAPLPVPLPLLPFRACNRRSAVTPRHAPVPQAAASPLRDAAARTRTAHTPGTNAWMVFQCRLQGQAASRPPALVRRQLRTNAHIIPINPARGMLPHTVATPTHAMQNNTQSNAVCTLPAQQVSGGGGKTSHPPTIADAYRPPRTTTPPQHVPQRSGGLTRLQPAIASLHTLRGRSRHHAAHVGDDEAAARCHRRHQLHRICRGAGRRRRRRHGCCRRLRDAIHSGGSRVAGGGGPASSDRRRTTAALEEDSAHARSPSNL